MRRPTDSSSCRCRIQYSSEGTSEHISIRKVFIQQRCRFLAVTWQLWEKVQRKAAFTTKTSCGFLQVDEKSKITQTSLAELSITTETAPSQALKPCLKYSPAKSMTQMHVNIKTFRSITTVLHLGAVPIYSFWIWA